MTAASHNATLAAAIAVQRIEPKILTSQLQRQLADYNAARRQVVRAGCSVINERGGDLRGIELRPDAAGAAFVRRGGCTRTTLALPDRSNNVKLATSRDGSSPSRSRFLP